MGHDTFWILKVFYLFGFPTNMQDDLKAQGVTYVSEVSLSIGSRQPSSQKLRAT